MQVGPARSGAGLTWEPSSQAEDFWGFSLLGGRATK